MSAKLFVEIVVSKSGDLILKGLKGEVGNLNKKLKGTHDISRQLATGFKLLASTWALLKIKSFIKDWTNLYEEMEKADKLLDQAAANSGKYSRAWSLATREMASALQDLTGTHRLMIEMGQRLLITFDEITTDMLPRATLAMVNYAAFTGVSMNSAAKAVGKASMGLLGDLKRVGVQVDETTYRTKGFIGILGQLENQMGGQAETFRKTTAGQWAAWKNEIKDVKIELGEFFDMFFVKTGLLGAFTKSLGEFADILKGMKGEALATEFRQIALQLLEMAAALGEVIDMIITGWRMLGIEKAPKGWEMIIKGLGAGLTKGLELFERHIYGDEDYADIWAELTEQQLDDLNRIAKAVEKINSLETKRLGIANAIARIQAAIKITDVGDGGAPINRVIPEISVWTNIWESFTQDITGIFQRGWVDSLTNMELDFTKFAKQLNAKMVQAFIQNIWDVKAFTYGGTVMAPTTANQFWSQGGVNTQDAKQVSYGQMMGVGAAGYSAYQGGSPGQGALTGAMVGGQFGGLEALFGGAVGGLLGSFGGREKRPEINLLWKVVNGEVELIAEEWKHTARDKGVIDSVRQALQAQVDFFNQIAFIAKRAGLDVTAQTTFATGATPDTPAAKYHDFMANYENYEEMFGGALEVYEALRDKKYELLRPSLRTEAWENDFREMTEEDYNKPGWAGQGSITAITDAFFDGIEKEFTEISNFMADAIGNAFIASLETGDFDTFKQTLKEGLFQSMVEGVTLALTKNIMQSILGRALDIGGLMSNISSYGTEGGITQVELIASINAFAQGIGPAIEAAREIVNPLIQALTGVEMELGINTEALYSNIESLLNYLDTINETVHGLTVSDLAPVLSQKVFAAEYTRLQGGAGSQEGLDDFIRYIQSEYLPFMRDYATDYAGSFEKVIEDLRALEEEPRDKIIDFLQKIYENLGGESTNMMTIINDLELKPIHINETELEKMGLYVKNGVIVGLEDVAEKIAMAIEASRPSLPFQAGWEGNVVNQEQLHLTSLPGGGMPGYMVMIVEGQKVIYDTKIGEIVGLYDG